MNTSKYLVILVGGLLFASGASFAGPGKAMEISEKGRTELHKRLSGAKSEKEAAEAFRSVIAGEHLDVNASFEDIFEFSGREFQRELENDAKDGKKGAAEALEARKSNGEGMDLARLEARISSLEGPGGEMATSMGRLRNIRQKIAKLNAYGIINEGKGFGGLDAIHSFGSNADGSVNHKAIESFEKVIEKTLAGADTAILQANKSPGGAEKALSRIQLRAIFRSALQEMFPKADPKLLEEIEKRCT